MLTPSSPHRFTGSSKGYGFINLGDGKPDVFIASDDRNGAQHGDIVEFSIIKTRHDGRREGVIGSILSPHPATWVGSAVLKQGVLCLRPHDPRFPWVRIPTTTQAPEGSLIAVQIKQAGPWQSEDEFTSSLEVQQPAQTSVLVLKVSADQSQASGVSRVHAYLHGFKDHENSVIELASELSKNISPHPWKQSDLRHVPFVSIDGSNTKDFDDVVWARKTPEGFELWVGIADVAAYVQKGSPLDEAARIRATSVYLPGLVMPMLPPALSEGACSLKPNQDRLALVLCVKVDHSGKLSDPRFMAAKIKSHARLTYDGLSSWLNGNENHAPPSSTVEGLVALNELTICLLAARARRGALDFNRPSYSLSINSQGKVRGVYSPTRTHAHRIVEECMVLANVAAATYLRQAGLPVLSRYHPAPHPERLAALFNRFPDKQGVPVRDLVSMSATQPSLLPFLRQAAGSAQYSSFQSGHFGLALDEYAHFTSPIRRYPDIIIHRAIHVSLGNLPASVLDEDWERLGQLTTERERAAASAERAATDQLRIQWLSEQDISTDYEAIIDGATPAGVFLTLESVGASGLLRPPEGAEYLASHKTWKLPNGQAWTLGDKLNVQVLLVDVQSRKVSLGLAQPCLDIDLPNATIGKPKPAGLG